MDEVSRDPDDALDGPFGRVVRGVEDDDLAALDREFGVSEDDARTRREGHFLEEDAVEGRLGEFGGGVCVQVRRHGGPAHGHDA